MAVAVFKSKYAGETVRLTDLVQPQHPVLTDFTFERCEILGPAVVHFQASDLVACTWDAPNDDALIWDIDPVTRPFAIGAIAAVTCVFRQCTFKGIGIAADAAFREQFTKDVGRN